jgi:hypothetical protein
MSWTDGLVIWLRARKELILRMLRGAWGGLMLGFLLSVLRDCQAKMAARACQNRLAVRGETGLLRRMKKCQKRQ